MTGRLAAVTGATGFLGRHIVHALTRDGWRVRVLARRDPAPWIANDAPAVVRGDLADAAALDRLCDGTDALIHAAGLVRARRDTEFFRVNAEGAEAMATAARRTASQASFLLVSSLAAREPQLSAYARSKREGEARVLAVFGGRAQVARPCAVYGPGDLASAPLFRAAASWPVLPTPSDPRARLTLVHVADCARDIARMIAAPEPGRTAVLTDDRTDGYGWREIGETLARAAGARRRLLPIGPSVLRAVGAAADIARAIGADTMAGSGKMREILHGDWSVRPEERLAGAPAHRSLIDGFAQTLRAMRPQGCDDPA